MNDVKLLFNIQAIISDFFIRFKSLNNIDPKKLKNLVRAFYEAKYNPEGGYIHNYNNYTRLQQVKKFLMDFGYYNKYDLNKLNNRQIRALFKNIKGKRLAALEQDVGIIS